MIKLFYLQTFFITKI